ncbi:MAG: phosphatase PAP2 family protein [Tannerellaceae bacterium]|nr:phosphatase PAP2 family protein [Tannerellaceae bacterium]
MERKSIGICFYLVMLLWIIYMPVKGEELHPDTAAFSSGLSIVRTGNTFNSRHLILPASLITAGAIGTAMNGMNDFHLFSRKDSVRSIHADDYLEWGMLGWVFVCDLLGNEKHTLADQFFLLALAEGMNAGIVHGLKNTIRQERPDGGPRSFPSGHTANSFLGAHLAYKEFKDSHPVLAWSGYAIAIFVGVSRIYNNRHWVADVLAGAGIGILSVELSYLIYFPVRDALLGNTKTKYAGNLVFAPSVTPEGGGIYISLRF